MLADQLDCASGQYSLVRPGAHPKQPLRAWDAADEYLIQHISSNFSDTHLLILNDQFGSLGCALHQNTLAWSSDSYCAKHALLSNLERNALPSELSIFDSLNLQDKKIDVAVIKIPKNTSFLDFQLKQCFELGIKHVFLAGMMKHLPKTLQNQLSKYGEVTRLPFVKKATIFELKLNLSPTASYPKHNRFMGVQLISHANVFGRDKLDPGAQFLLEHIVKLPSADRVADLCCGSGILGIKYAMQYASAALSFYDESFMAVESAKASWHENTLKNTADFHWNDGLGENPKSYDLILCNPPFHEAHTIGDHIAKRLFKHSKQALGGTGTMIVVGNRHLQYHQTLKKHFKHVEQIAANSKFVLLSAHG